MLSLVACAVYGDDGDLHDRGDAGSALDEPNDRGERAQAGVGFVDKLGWFCAHPRGSSSRYLCPLVVNRTVTCFDRGHISRTYGLELAPEFRLAFRRQLFS